MSAYETALQLLDGYGPEHHEPATRAVSNHGTIVAGALCALGRDDLVVPWVESYRARLQPQPPTLKTITATDWHTALGDPSRVSDWLAFFERQLGSFRWDAVVAEWAPVLAPGLSGAVGHGLLRTAHAVRACATDPTYLQRRELAAGLAYWAASFSPLPGGPVAHYGTHQDPVALLAGLELLDGELRVGGTVNDRLTCLHDHRGLAGATMSLDTGGDPALVLGRIVEAAAVLLATNAAPHTVVPLLHAVTTQVALRSLLPHVAPCSIAPILTYAWQFVAALHAAFADWPIPLDPLPAASQSLVSLVDTAIRSGDEHAIELAEAAVRMRTKGFSKTLEIALERSLPLLAQGRGGEHSSS